MKDAFYFPHDSNAKDDPKMVMLIEQLGMEGYGIYWVLVETLRDQPEYCYPIMLIPALARRYNTTTEKMRAVVLKYDLFKVQNEQFFYSESLCNRMLKYDDKREKARKAAAIRWGSDANALQPHSDSNAHPMPKRVEESKREEINILFDEFWNLYDKKVARAKCEPKWKKLKDSEREEIMETLPKFLKSIKDKQFQPHPYTYLNQRRWEDEIQEEDELSEFKKVIRQTDGYNS
jgi:hypothetical protein